MQFQVSSGRALMIDSKTSISQLENFTVEYNTDHKFEPLIVSETS